MKKRTLIAGSAALLALAVSPAIAAEGFTNFKPGMIKSELAKGKTVFVDYAASWCGTCRTQERVIRKLIKENPKYARSMKFIRVDWDRYGGAAVTTERNIPRRSTLIVLRGKKELGRVVAGTSTASIKALMNRGL